MFAGVRYFMIKSWTQDNIRDAIQNGMWATQEKNEDLFAEAYRTSRYVILFFSANKSQAFQGYVSVPPEAFSIIQNRKTRLSRAQAKALAFASQHAYTSPQ